MLRKEVAVACITALKGGRNGGTRLGPLERGRLVVPGAGTGSFGRRAWLHGLRFGGDQSDGGRRVNAAGGDMSGYLFFCYQIGQVPQVPVP